MNELLEYKGYHGSVEYSAADNCLFGKVIGIRSLISYEGESVEELKRDFMDGIDDYIASCEDI
jgi:predicted HicB family RNase H-like nuclease